MEISSSLLVSIMFVTILSMGIGNILMGLASIVDRQSGVITYPVHTGWVVLLLLLHFNLFWHMVDIFSMDDWKFIDFIVVICGPIILFFATSVLLSGGKEKDNEAHYYSVAKQFFVFLAILQVWNLLADLVLNRGFTDSGAFSIVVMVVFLVLSFSRNPNLHRMGHATVWILFLATLFLRGTGMMDS